MQKSGHSPHQIRHIERGELEFLTARECQHPLRQCRAALRSPKRVIEQLNSSWIGERKPSLQKLEAALDGHQQIVKIMRDAAGKMPDGFHLLRLDQRLARFIQRARRLRAP